MFNVLHFIRGYISPKKAICYFRHGNEDKNGADSIQDLFKWVALGKKAVAYYRSAYDAPNALDTQRASIRAFARKYGIKLIHEETDIGQNGISTNQDGLSNLFQQWILNDDAPIFEYVLLYDFSRWGRFQDLFRATIYEQLCKLRGKHVIYLSTFSPFS